MALTLARYYARITPSLGPCAILADLPDCLAYALRESGLPPTIADEVADSDMAVVPDTLLSQIDDLVVLQAYEDILNNLTDDLLREAGIRQSIKDLAPYYERRLQRQGEAVTKKYGIGLSIPSAGVISQDFQARGDDTFDGQRL